MNQIPKDNSVFCYPDIEVDKIKNILLNELFYDKELEIHFISIEQIMLNNGAVFFSPGGSFKRKLLFFEFDDLNFDKAELKFNLHVEDMVGNENEFEAIIYRKN